MDKIGYYAEKLGISLNETQIDQFRTYQELLLDWNGRMNLTTIIDPDEIALKHFADSLSVARFIRTAFGGRAGDLSGLSLIDVGTGAGFPGIPLKIAYPGLALTLMDSLQKRVAFLDAVVRDLSLSCCETVHCRAEDGARNPSYREKFDMAVARAVAGMPVLCEYCLPFVKPGGVFLAMKSNAKEEMDAARYAIGVLGGEPEDYNEFLLPESDIVRSVITVRKKGKTPNTYPRKAGKPEKEPLRAMPGKPQKS